LRKLYNLISNTKLSSFFTLIYQLSLALLLTRLYRSRDASCTPSSVRKPYRIRRISQTITLHNRLRKLRVVCQRWLSFLLQLFETIRAPHWLAELVWW